MKLKKLWLGIKIFLQAIYCIICDEGVKSKGKQLWTKRERIQARNDAINKLEEMKKEFKEIKKVRKKAWIIGNLISFEKPKYKSPFFPTEEVYIIFKNKNG